MSWIKEIKCEKCGRPLICKHCQNIAQDEANKWMREAYTEDKPRDIYRKERFD